MNLFKRRLSVHRTSQKLRSLWSEYTEHLQELSNHKYDSVKLKSLTTFLDSILDVEIPTTTSFSQTPISDSTSEDISIILTGLLDIIQRSTIELKSFIEVEQERIVLCEALRKALSVTELLVREKKNRKRIVDPADVICRIMSILSNLESLDDQVLALSVVSHLVRHVQCRVELSQQGGFKLLTSLYMNETILHTNQSAPFSSETLTPTPALKLVNSKILKIFQLCLVLEKKRSHMKSEDRRDQAPTGGPSHSHQVINTQRNQFTPPALLWGLSLAFSVVNEIISATPLSAAWLKRIRGGEFIENNTHPETDVNDPSIEDSCGGISLVIPLRFLHNDELEIDLVQWERNRLGTLTDSHIPNQMPRENSGEVGLDMDEDNTPDLDQPMTDLVSSMKSQGVTAILIDQMRIEISQLEELTPTEPTKTEDSLKQDHESICLLCTMKAYLIQNSSAQIQFHLEGGYDFLYTLIVSMLSLQHNPQPCLECVLNSPLVSNLETDSGKPLFVTDFQTNLIFFFLSLIFDYDTTPTHLITFFDSSISQAFHGILQIRNVNTLQLLLKLMEHEQTNVSLFALSVLEIILRLNPLSIVAMEAEGGLLRLQKLLINSLFIQSFSPLSSDEPQPSISHRADRSRSSSSGTSSVSLPTTTDSSVTQSSTEEHDSHLKLQEALSLTVETLQLLVRTDVIYSERNSSVLTFLVIAVQQLSQRFNPTSKSWMPQEKCSNCEAEIAEFECTHHSCSGDGLDHLCRECDRVFHKAVTKRTHIRIPVSSHLTVLNTLKLGMESGMRQLIDQIHNTCSRVIRFSWGQEYLLNSMCLLVHHIKTLMDDRRKRNQRLVEELLPMTIISLRLMLTTSFQFEGKSIQISSTSTLHEISPELSGTILHAKSVDTSNSDSGNIDEPPEDCQGTCHRVILSLLVQIVARYFTSPQSPLHLDDRWKSSDLEESVQESRSVMLDRIRTIRQLGFEACLVLLATANTSRIPLTSSDRQYALITLREIITEAYRSDIGHGVSLLRWFVWLLCSPVYSSHSQQPVLTIEPRIRKYSAHINSRLVRELIRDHEGRGAIFSDIPTETIPIPLQLRIFIFQELRILLGGDDWIPVISDPHIARVDARTDYIPPAHQDHENDDCGFSLRIPVSKKIIQNHLVKAGIIEILANIINGDLSSSTIFHLMNETMTSERLSEEVAQGKRDPLSDVEIVDWWAAIATLTSLITNSSLAKEEFDASLGVTEFTKIILPFIEHNHPISRKTGMTRFQISLTNLLIEICTSGQRWLPPSRPFLTWSKVCLLNPPLINKVPISNCLFCRHLKLLSDFSHSPSGGQGYDFPVVPNDISPIYYTKTCAVRQHRECLFPQVIFRRTFSYTRGTIESKQAFGSLHLASRLKPDAASSHCGEQEYDDSSTCRGSFSLTSLHGFPRACSFSNFTPPPSLAGDVGPAGGGGMKMSFDEALFGSRSAHGPRINRTDSRADEIQPQTYNAQYIPLLAGLNWGLRQYDTLILGVLYEGLIARTSGEGNQQASDIDSPGKTGKPETQYLVLGTDPLLTSLRRQSVEQHMQSFLSLSDGSQSSLSLPPRWEPQYSRIVVRNSECVDLLFSLSLIFHGDPQLLIINSISRLIEGNPSNAEIISQRNIPLGLSKLLFRTEELSRNRISHVLSQLFKQRISAFELSDLVSTARTISDVDMKSLLTKNQIPSTIPVKGLRAINTHRSETDFDDSGCQILFMLGMSIENLGPTVYTHFDHSCPLSSQVLLPLVDKMPPSNVGFSVVSWIKVSNVGLVPISVLMQLTVGSDGKSVPSSDSCTQVIDIFFRVIYKQGNLKESDANSVASYGHDYPPIGNPQEDLVRKRILQLCISYRSSHETSPPSSSEQDPETILALDPRMISSLAHFSTPDVIIEYDWSEMSDWRLLCLSFSTLGVSCTIDGIQKRSLYWTALGYSEIIDPLAEPLKSSLSQKEKDKELPKSSLKQRPLGTNYLHIGKEQHLTVSLGGLYYEQGIYSNSLEHLSDLVEKCKLSTQDPSIEAKISTEVDFLQCYKEMICGFSGNISTMALFEGILDSLTLLTLYHAGAGPSILTLPSISYKKITMFNSMDSSLHRISPQKFSTQTGAQLRQATEGERGRDQMTRYQSNQDDTTDGKRNSRRISRSLSPVSASRTLEKEMSILSYDDNSSRGHVRSSTVTSESFLPITQPSQNTCTQSSSLVSDLFTMFSSGPPKEDDHQGPNKIAVSDVPVIYGSTKIFTSKILANEMSLLGGLRFLYPFLVIDRSRQIATLRIISTLYSTFKSIQEEYATLGVDKVILYCLHVTPYISTQSSIQILFDLAVSSTLRDSLTLSLNSKTIDKISRLEFMRLAIEIAVASPKRIQLARCTIEWLLGVCDDSLENINTVLGSVGLIPFLLILSLWLCENLQDIEQIDSLVRDDTENDSNTTRQQNSFVKIQQAEDRPSTQKSPKKSVDFILSSDPSNLKHSSLPYKTQVAIAKFLRLLITGSVGQLSPLTIPVSQQTPTGFNTVHLTTLLSFIQYIARHEEISTRSKCDPETGMSVTTPIHHPSSPHAWRLYAAQLALDILLESCEGPLSGTIMNMIRIILPGLPLHQPLTTVSSQFEFTGTGIWNYIFDLLSCPHIAIKVRAIHFLGLSFSGNNGEIDSRQVLQFEKMQGFPSLASRLSDYIGDTEPITDSLLSLLFWRRTVRVGSSNEPPSNQNPLFERLDVIDEVESLASSIPERSRQNTIDGETLKLHEDEVLLALDGSDLENEVTLQTTHESIPAPPDLPEDQPRQPLLEPSGDLSSHTHDELPTEYPEPDSSLSTVDSQPLTQNSSGGFMSLFSWIGKSEGNPDGRLSNEETRPEITKRDGEAVTGKTEPDKNVNSSDQKFGSKMGKLRIKVEVIVLPQILQAILSVLQNENSSERVLYAMSAIESSLTPFTVCNGSGKDPIDQESLERCTRNAETLYGQKEWLLWMCDCMLCFQRRFSQGNLIDATNLLSTSEGESASGLESGDESCDGSTHHYSSTSSSRRISTSASGYISPPCNVSVTVTVLDKFYDPLLNTIQAAFAFDILQKPSTSRKIYDIFRLPVPEARDIQLLIMFDLVELFEKQQSFKTNVDRTLNLMRNMSTLLDQILEKSEITLEFCVRAIQAMSSLIYHAPQEIRLKIKDTLLFDVKHAYVMRCLVDRQEDIWERVTCLSSIHTSIADLISSGIPNRTLQDHYLLVLFLDIFLQATCDMYSVVDSASSGERGGGGGVRSLAVPLTSSIPEEYFNLQLAALVLIQNCVQTSGECKRSIEKFLVTDFNDEQHDILYDGLCNHFRRRSATPVNDDDHSTMVATTPNSTTGSSPSQGSQLLMHQSGGSAQKSSSWWSSWGSTSEASGSTSIPPLPPSPQNNPRHSLAESTGKSVSSGEESQADIETGRPSEDDHEENITVVSRPDDSVAFLNWLNLSHNRECIEILTKKVAKLLPALYQKTDKIQEKIAQRRSRHVRQVQERHTRDKATLNKSVHETLSKATSASEKFSRRYAQDANRWVSELKEKILKGSNEFQKCLEVPTPFEREPQSSTLPTNSHSNSQLGVTQKSDPPTAGEGVGAQINLLLDQIMSELHGQLY